MPSQRRRRLRRFLVALLLVLAIAGAAAPFIGADRFRPTLASSLEQALRRRVELAGPVRFRLLPRPGFSLHQVVIHERREHGIEPFAYASTLDIAVSLAALLSGRLEPASIRLVEPSVNLMKSDDSGWNILAFFQDAMDPAGGGLAALPSIEVTSGRLNFKFGETKSVFYLADTDLSIELDRSQSTRFGIRIEGEPARTDRAQRAFGRLSGRGMLELPTAPGGEPHIQLSLAVERTPIAEVLALVQGRGIGLGGFAATHTRLAGPVSAVEISGRFELDQFERLGWLLPRAAGWAVAFHGRLDLPQQQFRIETLPAARGQTPASLRLRASELFRRPRWAAIVTLREAPLASLRSLASELGAPLPAEPRAEGSITGAIGFAPSGIQGALQLEGASLGADPKRPMRMEPARLILDRHQFHLLPATVQADSGDTASIEATFDASSGATSIGLQTSAIRLADLRGIWPGLVRVKLPSILERATSGVWSGVLRAQTSPESPPALSAAGRLTATTLPIEGLDRAVEIQSASVGMRAGVFSIHALQAKAGPLSFAGDLSVDVLGRRPHRARIRAAEASLAELQKLFAPALPRPSGLIARTLGRRGGKLPAWMADRPWEVALEFGSLEAGDQRLTSVTGQLTCEAGRIRLRRLEANASGGSLSGEGSLDLAASAPEYRWQARLRDGIFRDGTVDLELEGEASGAGGELLPGLRLQGRFATRNVAFTSDQDWHSASGAFVYGPPAGPGRLILTSLQASIGNENYAGQGASTADGRIQIELSAAGKPMRIAGRISGFSLDFSIPR